MVELDIRSLLSEGGKLVGRFGEEAYFAAVCMRSGLVGLELPHRIVQMLQALDRYGALGAAVRIGAIRHGNRVALVDELGELTYKQLDDRANALANAWRARGLQAGDGVAILA